MEEANLKQGSKENPKYFRGDELPGVTMKASLSPVAVPAGTPEETANH